MKKRELSCQFIMGLMGGAKPPDHTKRKLFYVLGVERTRNKVQDWIKENIENFHCDGKYLKSFMWNTIEVNFNLTFGDRGWVFKLINDAIGDKSE